MWLSQSPRQCEVDTTKPKNDLQIHFAAFEETICTRKFGRIHLTDRSATAKCELGLERQCCQDFSWLSSVLSAPLLSASSCGRCTRQLAGQGAQSSSKSLSALKPPLHKTERSKEFQKGLGPKMTNLFTSLMMSAPSFRHLQRGHAPS